MDSLHGLGLQYYRGIGGRTQKMAPFRQFNIFIGANNAGKSTVLNFISKYVSGYGSERRDRRKIAVESLERHIGQDTGPIVVLFGVPEKEFFEAAQNGMPEHDSQPKALLKKLISKLAEISLVMRCIFKELRIENIDQEVRPLLS